jgi:electron transport complex protein RnfB
MIEAILALTALAALFGGGLGIAAIRLRPTSDPVVDEIDKRLPQTQCAQCGYPGCRPYAEAIARGEADINQCPPGGEATVAELADLLDREPKPLDPDYGETPEQPLIAWIDESLCIGCTKCLDACPVDAILGAHQQMHTVIEAECTGCELCVEPCPVDCIHMVPVATDTGSWRWPAPGNRSEASAP